MYTPIDLSVRLGLRNRMVQLLSAMRTYRTAQRTLSWQSIPQAYSLLLASLLALCSHFSSQAQLVFIPDVQMRAWLNTVIPDVVDPAGYMDTAHPSIPYVTYYTMYVDWDPADLTGLEYLTGIDTLTISFGSPPYTSVTLNALPPNLRQLRMLHYPGATLPPLPSTLANFQLYDANNLTSISNWPPELKYASLEASSSLTTIAPFPGTMNVVHLYALTSLTDISSVLPDTITGTLNLESLFQLSQLPPFPYFEESDTLLLTNLWLIDSLPSLPDHIGLLRVRSLQQLTSLPPLPADLQHLQLQILPQLVPVPEFPSDLRYIELLSLPLVQEIPSLPDSLMGLAIGQLPLLECLPTIPSMLQVMIAFDSGVDCAPNIPPSVNTTNLPLCGFYNAGICPFYSPSISGHVFHDLNTNGTRDPGEVGFGQATVQFAPGNTITGVMNSGFYAQALDSGTYAITPNVSNPYVLSISPTSHSASLVNINDVDSLNDFAVQLQPNVQDLTTDLAFLSHARPGFNNMVHLSYRNEGTITMSGTVVFHFDDDQSWNSSTPAPDMISGNTATWNFTDLELGEQRQIFISLHTDASVILGTAIDHDAVAEPVNTDQTPADNVAFLSGEVVGAFDPNDISVLPSELTSAQVAAGELLTYTIRFQNTGTYLAERVIITDTLSSDLVWSSVEFIASSHPCSWYIHDGTLRVTFDQIMLPDSTSNEPDSHGFVRFSLAPDPGLLNGAQIGSTANIYFDYNPPVITNEAIFLVNDPTQVGDLARPDLSIRPNPVEDLLILEKTTSGTSLLEVLDLTGRVVVRTTFPGSMRTLDVRSLNSGSYLIRIDGRPMGRFVRR